MIRTYDLLGSMVEYFVGEPLRISSPRAHLARLRRPFSTMNRSGGLNRWRKQLMKRTRWIMLLGVVLIGSSVLERGQFDPPKKEVLLPTGQMIFAPLSGQPRKTNSFPASVALSPDGRYLAILNSGYGTAESYGQQSIAILDLETHKLHDYPEARLGRHARQTYFLGLAFSRDGSRLYASIASLTDPEGQGSGHTGNGIAVYGFEGGKPKPFGFLRIPLQELPPGKHALGIARDLPQGKLIPYPAGLALAATANAERLLVADDLSDDALLVDAADGQVIHRFELSAHPDIPGSYPYGIVITRDGMRGYCSLWNDSEVAELDLEAGRIVRRIALLKPDSPTAPGSHPTAMLLSPDEKLLYVTLSNADRVAVIETATGTLVGQLSTELPGQRYGGTFPNALAETRDGSRLFVADASANAVAVFDMGRTFEKAPSVPRKPLGFIPTGWYPTALAVDGEDLLVASGKGEGTGANSSQLPSSDGESRGPHPYIASLIHGSIAEISIPKAEPLLSKLTEQVRESNRMAASSDVLRFAGGKNPIQHVIYIIKENRSYDQVFGDLEPGNADPSLGMYGEDITPNQHKLARQFGILDNFYVSGEVSGDGHAWSMAATVSDYTEKTWEISYRGDEHTYDYEGLVAKSIPLEEGFADINEPATGYIWSDVERNGLTHRNYGEFVATEWCEESPGQKLPGAGPPQPLHGDCSKTFILKGEPLPSNVGDPHGSPSPWPWPVPNIARNIATKPELRGHFDPLFPDFNVYYPDQLRVDEFLNEFSGFVESRKEGRKAEELPQFVLLRLPDDHTLGTLPGGPRPAASVADNDLAFGRVVDAVSHSPYWDDTAIFVLEDDAQDGPDHVDAHRSIAFVISKYSPGSSKHPFVDPGFYTTVSMIRTMETLLGLPPMNNNDANAAVMAPLFEGLGTQPPFEADFRNRTNGLIYLTNPLHAPGGQESSRMDFSHADAANAGQLNLILWRDRKGNTPMPPPQHNVFPKKAGDD